MTDSRTPSHGDKAVRIGAAGVALGLIFLGLVAAALLWSQPDPGLDEQSTPDSIAEAGPNWTQAKTQPQHAATPGSPPAPELLCAAVVDQPDPSTRVYVVRNDFDDPDPAKAQSARQISIVIRTSTPIALILVSHDAAIWNIERSEHAHIQAAYALGHFPQRITGLSRTPNATHAAVFGDDCAAGALRETGSHGDQRLASVLLKQPLFESAKIRGQRLVIDGGNTAIANSNSAPTARPSHSEPVMNTTRRSTSSQSAATRNARTAQTPREHAPPPVQQTPKRPSGEEELRLAMRAGVLRPGGPSDLDLWKRAFERHQRRKMPSEKWQYLSHMPAYRVTGDFEAPQGLNGAHAVVFVVPHGAPIPLGEPGHSLILDVDTGTCIGMTCDYYLNP